MIQRMYWIVLLASILVAAYSLLLVIYERQENHKLSEELTESRFVIDHQREVIREQTCIMENLLQKHPNDVDTFNCGPDDSLVVIGPY